MLLAVSLPSEGQRPENPLPLLRAFQPGGETAVPEEVAAWVHAARNDKELRALAAAGLLEVAASREVHPEARRIALRHLALVGGEPEVSGLQALLAEEAVAEYAAAALARVPGEAATRAMIDGLAHGHPTIRVALLAALAERRASDAVPVAAKLAADADPEASGMALTALARIADAAAVAELRGLLGTVPSDRRAQAASALIEAAEIVSNDGRREEGRSLLALLASEPLPTGSRSRLLWLQARLEPAMAAERVVQALLGADAAERRMAARLARSLPGPYLTRRLSALLTERDASSRLLILAILADRRDPVATRPVADLLRSPDVEVRTAAARTLGAIGGRDAVAPLVAAAGTGRGQLRETSLASLERMPGAGVDDALVEIVRSGAPDRKEVALSALTSRRFAGTAALAVRYLRHPAPGVVEAAARALREMGRPEYLAQVLDAALARPLAQRDPLLDTAAALALRIPDPARRAAPVLQRMRALKSPADRADLLGVAAMVGGAEALKAIRLALREPDRELRDAALQALCTWPSDEPLTDLRAVVLRPRDARERSIALRGFLQMIAAGKSRTAVEAEGLYREALGLCKNAAEKRMVLGGLAALHTAGSLELVASLLGNREVAMEAEAALLQVAPATLAARTERTLALLRSVAASSSDVEHRARAQALVDLAPRMGDFLLAWEVSPPYERAGLSCLELFDTPFAPEIPALAATVPWRLMPVLTNPEQPWLLDLLALYPGEQKVAYLRTRIWAASARDVLLELGSDDGAKLWLNGNVVFANNTQRAVAPAQERIKLTLRQGWNTLLLKITQNVMGWGAAARLSDAAGPSAPSGVRVDPLGK